MNNTGVQAIPEPVPDGQALRDVDSFGPRLRHARRVKKMRLRDVADAVGCSESMMSKIECGRVMPSLKMLHRVAVALDTSIAALFNTDEDQDLVVYKSGERQSVTIKDGKTDAGIHHHRQTDDLGAGLEVAEGAASDHLGNLDGPGASLKDFALTMPDRVFGDHAPVRVDGYGAAFRFADFDPRHLGLQPVTGGGDPDRPALFQCGIRVQGL